MSLGSWELFNILWYEGLGLVGWQGTEKTDDDDSLELIVTALNDWLPSTR